jgi:trk system potassium uptake protein TrkH
MKIKAILKLLSLLMLIISAFMGTAILVALYYGEAQRVIHAFLIPIGINVAFFLAMLAFFGQKEQDYFSPKSGFMFVSLSWIVASGIGALPYVLSGAIPSYCDAYFETMSGFTTTGASILSDVEVLPKAILYWRSLTHWLGGMGIVVLTMAIFPLLGLGGLQVMDAESPGPSVDKITPRIAGTAKILWLIYIIFTVAQTVLLRLGGMGWFDSLCHTFGSLATGGFSTKNASVGHWDSAYIHWVITIFMIMSGANFVLYYKLIRGEFRTVLRDSELRAYLGIVIATTLGIALNLMDRGVYKSFDTAVQYAAFQVGSIMTTTGYATADFDKWPFFSQVILFFLMFIGGCAGSTGGGPKVVRIVTMFKQAIAEMKYLVSPRGVFSVRVNGQPVKKVMIFDIASFIFLYMVVLLAGMLVVASAGYDISTSISAIAATLGNIGPGFNKVGPTVNYGHFPDYVKWALSFAMMAGRLELYTVLVLLTPAYWRK